MTTFGSWAISNLDFDGKQRHNPGLELCTHDIFNYECWSGFRTVVLKLVLINVVILNGCSWVFFGKLLVVNWTPQSIISSECIRSYKTYKYHTGVRSWFRLELGRNLCDIWQSSWTHSYSRITYTPISLGHDNRKLWVYVPAPTDWIGLDLFNHDTRPSGHISRPTQVNVSQSCFHSLNNYSSLIIL